MRETKNASEAENLADAQRLAAMFEAVNRLPVPLIGKIHGAALGGGTGLAACCDHVLAVSDASFGLTEVRLGIVPAVISPYVIAKIGHSQARSLFTSGRRFSADEGLRIGLVHEVPEDRESLEIRTQIAIKEWLKAGPQAARAAKKLIFDLPALPSAEKIREHTVRLIAGIRVGEEAQEGMGALLEKRKPRWFPEE
ncbi:MAG: enoyl-CoA hydratase/isomerase family protein, partial [Alphaproteobacteria bacterium]|nr:enoyl-CoA hydratase/isomerase family protein [Alphaproteobacteria bacterium]